MHKFFSLLPAALVLGLAPSLCFADTNQSAFYSQVSDGALLRTKTSVLYDGSYRALSYPWGDIPDGIGVCADVVIRAYRHAQIDLQQLVHRDMKKSFSLYPKQWRARRPDRNIDHRRVLNLEVFFARHGLSFKPSNLGKDYKAGDIVSWRFADGRPHIGVISSRKSGGNPLVVHNAGGGTVAEDVLFAFKLVGHYRFRPNKKLLRGHLAKPEASRN